MHLWKNSEITEFKQKKLFYSRKKFQTQSDNLIVNAAKFPRESAVATPGTLCPREQLT
jgi:hypothetical protein